MARARPATEREWVEYLSTLPEPVVAPLEAGLRQTVQMLVPGERGLAVERLVAELAAMLREMKAGERAPEGPRDDVVRIQSMRQAAEQIEAALTTNARSLGLTIARAKAAMTLGADPHDRTLDGMVSIIVESLRYAERRLTERPVRPGRTKSQAVSWAIEYLSHRGLDAQTHAALAGLAMQAAGIEVTDEARAILRKLSRGQGDHPETRTTG